MTARQMIQSRTPFDLTTIKHGDKIQFLIPKTTGCKKMVGVVRQIYSNRVVVLLSIQREKVIYPLEITKIINRCPCI